MRKKGKLPKFTTQNDHLDKYRKRLYYNIPFLKKKIKENGVVVGELESKNEQRFQVMRQINAKLLSGYTDLQIVLWLENENFYSGKHQGYVIIRETKLVFGDVADSDKRGNTYVMIGNFQRIAQSFRRAGDLINEAMVLKEIAKLQGLYDNNEEADFSQFAMPRQLVFTTQAIVQEDIIETDYEESQEDD